tara:strand:- start:1118 stop:1429 length:312 start_codon:yes stop_codon:yes gene_type:complete
MPVIISEHVTEAMSKEKLSQKQIRRLGLAATIASKSFGPSAPLYRIQFDCNRTVNVVGNKKPCQASLYIYRMDGAKVFVSTIKKKQTNQVGLVKFIKDHGGVP